MLKMEKQRRRMAFTVVELIWMMSPKRQTVLANFYPKFGPRLRQTQFLSKFRIRPQKKFFFFLRFPWAVLRAFWPFSMSTSKSRQQFTSTTAAKVGR
jgi:hypothetical protein